MTTLSYTVKSIKEICLQALYSSECNFVCSDSFEGRVMSVVGTDIQSLTILNDFVLVKIQFVVVCRESTHNRDDFYVIPTVYEHKMIWNRSCC